MPLSRLENFLRNPKGSIIYVDPGNFDATDSFDNRGDGATRPFKTIQRALIEASRFSYQLGINNDLNDRTTVLVSSGIHYIDNRPGLSIQNVAENAVYRKRTGATTWTVDTLTEFSKNSNFNIFDFNNDLYKFNSTEGGVILPRGTSIVGLDLRKAKIRPLYVPDPTADDVDRSSIFKVTGNCYFTSFTFFDADPAVSIYKDYTYQLVNPKFSHHKLTAFTYADGVNKVKLGYEQTNLTDLDMYYYKIANAYGNTSGRAIPNYPVTMDFEPAIDEYRIVGVLEENLLGISSIRSGNGTGSGVLNEITVITKDILTGLVKSHNLNENTPILISGITQDPESYNGSFIVKTIVDPNTFTYIASSIPVVKLPTSPTLENALVKVESDTTSSSSPYIFNCSLRSVYGMCGLWADGSKSTGFKSVVVAQFTGISLQKDDNAFLLYSGEYNNYLTNGQLTLNDVNKPLHANSYSIYNPKYESFHIRASNNSFIQCVSIFAIGFSKQFVTETGADMSITNSNSNFGALALESYGFRDTSFNRDDVGYITHIIPPKETINTSIEINWLPINVNLTLSLSNTTNKRLYIYAYNNIDIIPPYKIDGYRVGAKNADVLNILLDNTETRFTSPILMGVYGSGTGVSSRKESIIARSGNLNNISADQITFDSNHKFISGEKIRIYSNTGEVPVGLQTDIIYYVIRTGPTTIRLAYNYNDAIASSPVNISGISNNGGIITVRSSVTDKLPGDVGHPIQYDDDVDVKNWYITSSKDSTNQIYDKILDLGTSTLGDVTPISTFSRRAETRSIEDRLYKLRYVIPKEYTDVREPIVGFVLQETKTVGVTKNSVTPEALLTIIDRRNERIINSISAGTISNNSQIVTTKTEAPHRLLTGDVVKIENVKSTYNSSAIGITSSFNGSFTVLTIPDSHTFTYKIVGVSTNPGAFTNNINTRTEATLPSLPKASREQYDNTFSIYRVDTIKSHISGNNGQDGVYHLTILTSNASLPDSIGYGLSLKEFNQDVRNLYPQVDRDNYNSDPQASTSFADLNVIGKVITNEKTKSLTKESLSYFIQNNNVGFNIDSITLSGAGNTTLTLQSNVEHKLNSIKTISLTSGGSGHSGSYYGAPVKIGSTLTDAVCNYQTSAGAIIAGTIEFIDFGSNFSVGDTIGIGTLGATATVSAINSNVSDGLELSGFLQTELNGVFRIISIPNTKQVVIQHPTGINSYIENTNSRTPFAYISSKGVSISSLVFGDITTGIVTATTSSAHGLLMGNNFTVVNSGVTLFNSTFTVKDIVGLTTFTFNVGIATTTASSSKGNILRGTLYPNSKTTGKTGENLGYRTNCIYGGVSTTLVSLTETQTGTQITLTNGSGFIRGDYIQVNSEILRLTQLSSTNVFLVRRAVFGTLKYPSTAGMVVQKIKILPMELRRPSFLRASGHTFEYLGYGPGNYSTAVPQKQTRKLTDDEVLVSQSREIMGGTIVYSGMNDLGEFYSGSKKLNSASGLETIVEAPILTFTGDDVDGTEDASKLAGIFDKLLVRQSLTVEGGDNGTEASIFYGPVRFQNGISLQGDFGITTLDLNSKRFTVNDKTGALKPGTIAYTGPNPITYAGVSSSYIGEIYLTYGWRRWGLISKSATTWDLDLGASSSIKVTNLIVDNDLTINGVKFNGSEVDSFTVNKLKVTGISTFQGPIYGLNGTIKVVDNLNIGSGISSTRIKSDGRTIDIGLSPNVGFSTLNFHNDDSFYPEYGLRITRNSGIGSTKSQILHRGNQPLEIKTEDLGSSIAISNSGISTLSFSNDGIISTLRNTNTVGTGGAHFSIRNLNTGTSADAALSWRSGTNRYWFAGVDASDNYWKLAYSGASVLISQSDFTSEAVKLTVDDSGNVTATSFTGSFTGTATNATNADKVGVVSTSTNSIFYPTFVDSDNTTANYESVYSNPSFEYLPGTKVLRLENLVVRETTSLKNLTVTGSITGTAANATNATNITRVGTSTAINLNYRVVLGAPNNTAGISSTYVVSDASRLYYNPSTDTLTVGNLNGAATNATNADKVKVGFTSTNSIFYPTFVDSNNATANYESVYSNPGFEYLPGTKVLRLENLVVRETTSSKNLTVTESIYIGSAIPKAALDVGIGTLRVSYGDIVTNGSMYLFNTKDDLGGFYSNGGTDGSFSLHNVTPNGIIHIRIKAPGGTVGTIDSPEGTGTSLFAITAKCDSSGTKTIVGINNPTPTVTLDVNGNANISGIITAISFKGNGVIPVGGIIMWSGAIVNIPTGWALCNGSNGTPNLTDRFIVGAGSGYAVAATGGADSVTLSTSQIPSHNHSGITSTAGDHRHTVVANNTSDIGLSDANYAIAKIRNSTTPGISNYNLAQSDNTADPTLGKTNLAGAHLHNISAEGGGGSHENRPPYYALAFIMRTV